MLWGLSLMMIDPAKSLRCGFMLRVVAGELRSYHVSLNGKHLSALVTWLNWMHRDGCEWVKAENGMEDSTRVGPVGDAA